MNLRELLHDARDLFYSQNWYWSEAFLDVPLSPVHPSESPCGVVPWDGETGQAPSLYSAVTLAYLYSMDPGNPMWRDYLWTSDFDTQGQRVYVGGTANGHGFEIHRHLRMSPRWGIPTWHSASRED